MVRFEDIDAWLMQRQLVDLLNMARQNIMQHTMGIYGSGVKLGSDPCDTVDVIRSSRV